MDLWMKDWKDRLLDMYLYRQINMKNLNAWSILWNVEWMVGWLKAFLGVKMDGWNDKEVKIYIY